MQRERKSAEAIVNEFVITVKLEIFLISFDEMQSFLKNLYSKYPSVFTVDGLPLVPRSSDYFISDVLHPNDKGFCEYADNLYGIVEKLKIIK